MNNIEILLQLIEESQVSDHKCAELKTLMQQFSYYAQCRAAYGDLYARNLVLQMTAGKDSQHAG